MSPNVSTNMKHTFNTLNLIVDSSKKLFSKKKNHVQMDYKLAPKYLQFFLKHL